MDHFQVCRASIKLILEIVIKLTDWLWLASGKTKGRSRVWVVTYLFYCEDETLNLLLSYKPVTIR